MWKPCTIVISNTIAHGNSKKEMKKKKNQEEKQKRENIKRRKMGSKKTVPQA